MNVLIDTNILVSAALKDRDPERVVLFIAQQPDIDWVVSSEIVEEYKAVLSRPRFALPQDLLQRWFALIDRVCIRIEPPETINFPRDQKDAKFIACALASGAEYFVSGDRNFEDARKLLRTTIIPAKLFVRMFIETTTGNE